MLDNKKLYSYYFMYIILGVIYIMILKSIFEVIDVYHQYIKYTLILLFVFFGLILYKMNKYILIVQYFIHLTIFLFFRNSKTGFNFSFYLIKWLNNIWKNKIIFINVIGNILLFIPLGVIFNKNILYSLLVVLLVELSQVIFKKGIFDIVDIFLNTLGILIGLLGVELWQKIKKRDLKIKKKMMK